ncbi:hypothetical protein GSU69_19640 (plasmid) [Rathayibacter festucae]|uniref:Putative endonuclease Z1 domain-containing protein n=1 Tax=Rathayibacter festucae TaxID=110937 RepID=A0ABX6H5L9_9MICO|nr:Z1 domain-containing protein [Rathayibacter festucae]QHC65069.1 hypothetical protein GSU69_19640 [Rathayibacter festucae]
MTDSVLTPAPSYTGTVDIVVGNAMSGFLAAVAPPPSRETLLADATTILRSSAVSTLHPSSQTGLIVGRVQSGKTLSYEAVIALARDNGFALVVVISGISNPLLDQGVKRLRKDLTAADKQGWQFLINPAGDAQDESTLRSVRDNWANPATPKILKKTAVCLLLKHYGRIGAFKDLCAKLGWADQKVLIIDDEADQASLNTMFKSKKESPTYRNIRELREAFPNHAYLQYTATPQAPLLVTISDVLSPDFVHVLEPGEEYVGGPDYFGTSNKIVKVIQGNDLEMASDLEGPPPPSLENAMKEFVLGVSDVLAKGEYQTRSMLVHPSRLKENHGTFARWTRRIMKFWQDSLKDATDESDLKQSFVAAWNSLHSTDTSISDFETCWANMTYVLQNLSIREMNTRDSPSTPVIDWESSLAFILIGGQALDRGFTVEGLSVTYMPRDPGSWTADTIQQRARFFGYKRSYFDQCRLYLEPSLEMAFQRYVEHEKHMLQSLRKIQSGEATLKDWEREFFLDPSMKATRQSVMSIDTIAVKTGERWIFDPRPTPPGHKIETENAAFEALFGDVTYEQDGKHRRRVVPIPAILKFIEALPYPGGAPLPQFRALSLQLARLVDSDPEIDAALIEMRPGDLADRTLRSSAVQPFQGRSGKSYDGDRTVLDAARITVQVHRIAVRETRLAEPFTEAMILAIHTPDFLASGWLLEDTSE